MVIKFGSTFNFDGHNWAVTDIDEVKYVSYQGYVVIAHCLGPWDGVNPCESTFIDLLANGTPLGYSK